MLFQAPTHHSLSTESQVCPRKSTPWDDAQSELHFRLALVSSEMAASWCLVLATIQHFGHLLQVSWGSLEASFLMNKLEKLESLEVVILVKTAVAILVKIRESLAVAKLVSMQDILANCIL